MRTKDAPSATKATITTPNSASATKSERWMARRAFVRKSEDVFAAGSDAFVGTSEDVCAAGVEAEGEREPV